MPAPPLPPGARAWTTRHDDNNRDSGRYHPSQWPPGPWDDEPDKISWTDQATGRPCLIVRNPMGALCGYVAVDPGHPLHGASYDDVDVEVHGGLTFARGCQHSDDESRGICHVPDPGQPDDVWWFGFDTGHAFDLQPGLMAVERKIGRDLALPDDVYRTVGYVLAEVEQLAAQLNLP